MAILIIWTANLWSSQLDAFLTGVDGDLWNRLADINAPAKMKEWGRFEQANEEFAESWQCDDHDNCWLDDDPSEATIQTLRRDWFRKPNPDEERG